MDYQLFNTICHNTCYNKLNLVGFKLIMDTTIKYSIYFMLNFDANYKFNSNKI